MTRRTILWAAGALLGIAATVAVAWLASRLAGQQIGLAGEPVAVVARLAPRGAGAAPPTAAATTRGAVTRHRRPARARAPSGAPSQPSSPGTASPTAPPAPATSTSATTSPATAPTSNTSPARSAPQRPRATVGDDQRRRSPQSGAHRDD